ncbi:hypothetical protein ACLOJK_010275 [Asimina triloba]
MDVSLSMRVTGGFLFFFFRASECGVVFAAASFEWNQELPQEYGNNGFLAGKARVGDPTAENAGNALMRTTLLGRFACGGRENEGVKMH